jgi:predicted amidohydrolase YtcJ
MNEQRLGSARLAHCNAYRTLQTMGVSFGFGSDCMPLGPLFGLQSAVRHPIAAERITGQAALAAYTMHAARLAFADSQRGSLAPGADADLVVLSDDPAADHVDWASLHVVATFLAGERVFGPPAFASGAR